MRTALEVEGYDVREAADGIEALTVARVWRPDAIVLDMLMPTMNGWQFAEIYHRQAADAHSAPIIAITAAGPGAIRSAEASGMIAAVLAKPLDLDELTAAIELHVGGQRPV